MRRSRRGCAPRWRPRPVIVGAWPTRRWTAAVLAGCAASSGRSASASVSARAACSASASCAAPGAVAGSAPHRVGESCWFWLLGGLYTLIGANCLTSWVRWRPRRRLLRLCPPRVSATDRLCGRLDRWLTSCSVLGYLAISMSRVPRRAGPVGGRRTQPIAIAMLVGFVALQWAGGDLEPVPGMYHRDQFVAFLALIAAGLLLSRHGPRWAPPAPASTSGWWPRSSWSRSPMPAGRARLYFTEEDRDPAPTCRAH